MSAPGRREGGLVLRSLRRREELGPRKATPRGDGEVAEPGVRTSEVWEPERIAGLRGFFSSPSFLYGHMRNRVDAPSLCVRNHLRPAPSSTPSGCGRRWAEVGGGGRRWAGGRGGGGSPTTAMPGRATADTEWRRRTVRAHVRSLANHAEMLGWGGAVLPTHWRGAKRKGATVAVRRAGIM